MGTIFSIRCKVCGVLNACSCIRAVTVSIDKSWRSFKIQEGQEEETHTLLVVASVINRYSEADFSPQLLQLVQRWLKFNHHLLVKSHHVWISKISLEF